MSACSSGTSAQVRDPVRRPPQAPPASVASSRYLPLSSGLKWTLRSKAPGYEGKPVELEVAAAERGTYRVQFRNPWNDVQWTLRPEGARYYLTAIEYEANKAAMPEGTLYFDMDAPEGKSWKNAIGAIIVLSRSKTVQTADRTYRNCIQFRETNRRGDQLFWTFAPGAGLVQFGEGKYAFVLDRVQTSIRTVPGSQEATTSPVQPPASVRLPPRRPPIRPALKRGPIRVGLSTAPFAHLFEKPWQKMSDSEIQALMANREKNFERSIKEIGVNTLLIGARWPDIEPMKRQYKWEELDRHLRRAEKFGLTDSLFTFRYPDTTNKAAPKGLHDADFDKKKVQKRLFALLDELAPRLKRLHVTRFVFGNEVDVYFQAHPKHLDEYLTLYLQARSKIKELMPGVQVATTVTFGGIDNPKTFAIVKPLLDQSDFLSVTYYPLKDDFSARPPETVYADFKKMIATADAFPQIGDIVLPEVGYPSSALLGSSTALQADFFRNVFTQIRDHSDRFVFVSVFIMADLPEWMVEDFAKYYGLKGRENFKAYLATLGLFDRNGRSKSAWEVLKTEGPRLAGRRATDPGPRKLPSAPQRARPRPPI